MRLKVCVEEGESTAHKLQRALSRRGAALPGNSVRWILHPGITGPSGRQKDEWGIKWPESPARTVTSIVANTWTRTRSVKASPAGKTR